MAKKNATVKPIKQNPNLSKELKENEKIASTSVSSKGEYLISMGYAPRIKEDFHWFQLLPIILFSAITILIVQMANYERPMQQFFWYSGPNDLSDFFSYYKMITILICASFVLLVLLYRIFTQSLAIKRSVFYIPIIIYTSFVVFSYFLSDYKEFALWGWNDRFEGTLVLIAYMIMLFYTINSVNGEKSVKIILSAIGVSSGVLGLLGVSQALDKDIFRTTLGQKLITPNMMTESGKTVNELIDEAKEAGELLLNFTFQNKEIYQTVYNINYVSFYLSLLIPLFGLLLIFALSKRNNMPLYKKIVIMILFALLLYNLVGSASSGGFLGMFAVVVFAILLLRKRLLLLWKPLLVILTITILIGGITYNRWLPELTAAVNGVLGTNQPLVEETEAPYENTYLDYLITDNHNINLSVNGNKMVIETSFDNPSSLFIKDIDGNSLTLLPTPVASVYTLDSNQYGSFFIQQAQSNDGINFIILSIDHQERNWVFRITKDGVLFNNELGNTVKLDAQVPSYGWENNPNFGSGRGYIWSRTLPMMKKTVLLGHGADTYCIYFPHNDYVGKYNIGWDLNLIIDKPHNMYMGMWIGTGGLSLLAFLSVLALYFYQIIRIYWRRTLFSFLDFAGLGIALGILGFAVSGLVNDSSVSVMPMFYGLLGTGIAINHLLISEKPTRSS